MVWYSHLFQNFPQFIVIHTVKGFGIVNKAEIDVFLELSCFFDDLADVGKKSTIPQLNKLKKKTTWVKGKSDIQVNPWTDAYSHSQRCVRRAAWSLQRGQVTR